MKLPGQITTTEEVGSSAFWSHVSDLERIAATAEAWLDLTRQPGGSWVVKINNVELASDEQLDEAVYQALCSLERLGEVPGQEEI